MYRLINVSLRGITLISKFLLIFFFARYLEASEFGLYGLVVVTISYAIYPLGLDFYTVSTREIIQQKSEVWGGILRNQGVLISVLYVAFLPLLLLVFYTGLLPWAVAGWFFILVVGEHLNQEFTRLLIATSYPVSASFALFLRQGLWAIVVTMVMFFEPEYRRLDVVLLAWTIGQFFAFLVAIYVMSRHKIGGWCEQIDWLWIWRGVKVAFPFLLATLALRALFTIDRYWLDSLLGLEVLAVYVLFMGIGNAIMSFLDAGVFAFSYPTLISTFHERDAERFRQALKKLFTQTMTASLCLIFVSFLLLDPLLNWLDKPLYQDKEVMFFWIQLGMFLYSLSMVPHYALYAQGQDRPLIFSHIAGLIVFILATWLFSYFWILLAVPLGVCAAFLLIVVWKFTAYFLLTPIQYRFTILRH